MSFARCPSSLVLLAGAVFGCQGADSVTSLSDTTMTDALAAFTGSKAGDEREVAEGQLYAVVRKPKRGDG